MDEFGLFSHDPFDLNPPIKIMPLVYLKGGGGGSSGQVGYPAYMESMHSAWLTDLDTLITASTSPFLGATTWDPDLTLADSDAAIANFSSAVANLSPLSDWETAMATAQSKWEAVINDTLVDDSITAQATLLEADIRDNTLPIYQSGMRDINAVMTSAYVIGETIIWNKKTTEMNSFAAKLRMQSTMDRYKLIADSVKSILEQIKYQTDFEQVLMSTTVDSNRIKIVAKSEQCKEQFNLDEKDARWAFDMYQYGVDMMGGIGGGTVGAGTKPSTAQSALGGALSGAASGAMMGSAIPGIGTAVGAVVGGVVGLASGFL